MHRKLIAFIAMATMSVVIAVGSEGFSVAAETAEGPQFLRIRRDERKQPISMETAVVTYSNRRDPKRAGYFVDLVAAVHVGERSYYDELNKTFRDYDAVLYELVAPADANVPTPGGTSAHPVSVLQAAIKNVLELEFQLDRIDYQRPNFVHADLSPDEFRESMNNRDESFTKMFFRLMGQGMADQAKDPARSSDLAIFSALFSRDRAVELKRAMAVQFENMEQSTAAFEGPNGSTIITERNKRAMEILKAQMQDGKKRLAIFYGAAHLPDFDRNLTSEFGFQRDSDRWIEAWDLRASIKTSGKRDRKSK